MTLEWSSSYGPVDEDFADVSLLLKGEGANNSTTILDSSSNNLSVDVFGDAQISTAVNTPFGTGDGVLAFDGTGDYLTIPSSTDFEFGTGDFTIEFWFKVLSVSGVQILYDQRNGANQGPQPTLYTNSSSLFYFTDASDRITVGTVAINQWYHLALTREGSSTKAFIGGIQGGSTYTDTTTYTTGPSVFIGRNPDPSNPYPLNGYISNVRITKGVARYTENFDVPTAPFPILSPSTRIEVGDGFDVEAANYILAVEAADAAAGQSGGLEPAVRTAINNFVVGCKSDGIWNAIKASCILAGARTLDGALVPLVGTAPNKFGTADNWNYDRETGLQGDGSTNYLNANRNDDTDLQDNSHRSVYVSTAHTNPPLFGGYIGNYYTSPLRLSYILSAYDTNPLGRLITLERSSDGLQQFNLQGAATGFVGTSRDSSSSQSKARAVGSTVSFNVTSSPTVSGAANYVFARNFNGVLNSPTNARLAFYSIGESLDLAKLDTRISDFITAIGVAI